MNITVYLGQMKEMTHVYEKQLRNWGHGLETVEMHLFTVVLKVV